MQTKKIITALLVGGVFISSTYAFNFQKFKTIHHKVDKYLEIKEKKSNYGHYYKLVKTQLDQGANELFVKKSKNGLRKYIRGVVALKLIRNIEKHKIHKLHFKNKQIENVIKNAFNKKNTIELALKTNLSESKFLKKLKLYFENIKVIKFNNNIYLVDIPKNNIFAKVFAEEIQKGQIPDISFVGGNLIQPKAYKRFGLEGERKLWNMEKIEADKIQDDLKNDNKKITVAIVDTGIDKNHQDLSNQIWKNSKEIAGNGKDDDGNGYTDDTWGWDFGDNDNDPSNGADHGTHVGGTVGASVNGKGVYGVDSIVKLMAVKIFEKDSGYTDSYKLSKGIHYAVDNGAKVINLSLGGDGEGDLEKTAIDYAYDHNVIVVAAAGNENKDASNTYPCANTKTICVGATDENDQKADFSNYGNKVDIAAPGVNILSTIPDNKYAYYNGTSMATPHVAGLVAIIKAYHPEYNKEKILDILKKDGIDGPSNLGGKIINAKNVYNDIKPQENNNEEDPTTGDNTEIPNPDENNNSNNPTTGNNNQIEDPDNGNNNENNDGNNDGNENNNGHDNSNENNNGDNNSHKEHILPFPKPHIKVPNPKLPQPHFPWSKTQKQHKKPDVHIPTPPKAPVILNGKGHKVKAEFRGGFAGNRFGARANIGF